MSWDAVYEFGDYRPVAWVNSETGETRLRTNPPSEAVLCEMRSAPGSGCIEGCLNDTLLGEPCPLIDILADRDPETVDAWLG